MIYLCTVLYINILGKGSRGENPASPLPEGKGIRRKGKEEGKVAGCKTFSYLLSSIFPLLLSLSLACCSRVRAVCPACLRRKHRSEGLAPRWWKPDITAALAAPLDTLPEQGWVVATHSPQQPLRFMKSQLSFSSACLSFSSTPRISSSLIVLRPFCYWSAGEWSAGDNSNIACGICVWISRDYEFFDR